MLYGLSLTDTHVGARTRVATRSVGLISGDAKEEQKSGVSHTIRSPKPHSFRLPMRWGARLESCCGPILSWMSEASPRSLSGCLGRARCSGAAAAASHVRTASVLRAGRRSRGLLCSCIAVAATHRRPPGCEIGATRAAAQRGSGSACSACAACRPRSPPWPTAAPSGTARGAHRETLSQTHRGNAKLALTPGRFVVLSSSVVRHSTSTVEHRAHQGARNSERAHAASHPRPEPRRACVLRALQCCAAPAAGARPRGVVAAALSASPAKTPYGRGGAPGGRQG
jgi:hypothetical protein